MLPDTGRSLTYQGTVDYRSTPSNFLVRYHEIANIPLALSIENLDTLQAIFVTRPTTTYFGAQSFAVAGPTAWNSAES